MKKIIIASACLLASSISYAQQKLGYVNSQELIMSMPEAKKADADINAYAKVFQDQLAKMQSELETKYKAYEAGKKAGTLKDAMLELKEKELSDLQSNMQTTQQSAEEKISTKREEALKPITERADKAIQDVAKEKNYSFIFDSSAGGIIYATPADNIIKDVQTKLGIKATSEMETKMPPAPKPKTK
jgi:outer membrane protein